MHTRWMFLLCLAALLWGGVCHAQPITDEEFGSLEQAFAAAAGDEARLQAMVPLVAAYADSDPDTGLLVGKEALALARRLKDPIQECRTLLFMGRCCSRMSDYPRALELDLQALRLAESNRFLLEQNQALVAVGSIYGQLGESSQAIPYFEQGLALAKRRKDTARMVQAYNNLTNEMATMDKYGEALKYGHAGLELSRRIGDPDRQMFLLQSLGNLYFKQGDYVSARKYLFQAGNVPGAHPAPPFLSSLFLNLGYTYRAMADSLPLQDSFLPAKDSLRDARYLLERARVYLNLSREQSKKIGNLSQLSTTSWELSDIYIRLGNHQAALALFKQHIALNDSVNNEKNRARIDSLTFSRDLEVAGLKLEKTRQRQWFLWAGMALSFCVTALVLSRYRLKARSNRQLLAVNHEIELERARSENLLLNILPSQVAQELKETGHCQPRLHQNASVLFADFKDFSLMVPRLEVKELVGLLDFYFRAFDQIMEEEGAEKIKTIGDAYMAVAGVPNEDPDHAARLVHIGLRMLQFVHTEKEKRVAAGQPYFELKAGICSGPLASGIVGERKFVFDVWGETVNMAARLEQNGIIGRLNLSESTNRLVRDRYRCTSRGQVIIKHGLAVEMFFVEEALHMEETELAIRQEEHNQPIP